MSALAQGEGKRNAKYRKLLREKFVLLSDYVTEISDENEKRGPEKEEDFQVETNGVPLLTFKNSEGETLAEKTGFTLNRKKGPDMLADLIDEALKENGPIKPPKEMKPLLRAFQSAEKSLEQGRISPAIKELQKVIQLGDDRKKFPDDTPILAMEARYHLQRLSREARRDLDAADTLKRTDPAAARKEYQRILKIYSGLSEIQERGRASLETP